MFQRCVEARCPPEMAATVAWDVQQRFAENKRICVDAHHLVPLGRGAPGTAEPVVIVGWPQQVWLRLLFT